MKLRYCTHGFLKFIFPLCCCCCWYYYCCSCNFCCCCCCCCCHLCCCCCCCCCFRCCYLLLLCTIFAAATVVVLHSTGLSNRHNLQPSKIGVEAPFYFYPKISLLLQQHLSAKIYYAKERRRKGEERTPSLSSLAFVTC